MRDFTSEDGRYRYFYDDDDNQVRRFDTQTGALTVPDGQGGWTAPSSSGSSNSRSLASADNGGLVFAAEMRPSNAGTYYGLGVAARYHPHKSGDLLINGGIPGYNAGGMCSFISAGPERAAKVANWVTIAAQSPLANGRMCYDTVSRRAYCIADGGLIAYMDIDTGNISASGAVGSGNCVSAMYHEGLKAGFVITQAESILKSVTPTTGGYAASNKPDMTGVSFTANSILMATPTHVVIAADDLRDATKGFLHSSDGDNFVFCGGIPAMAADGDALFGEYINGRLYLCTTQGLWSSADNGATWRNDIPEGNSIRSIHHNDTTGLYIANGQTGVWHSTDGAVWTKVSNNQMYTRLSYVEDHRVFYGLDGQIYSENGTVLLSSSDVWESGLNHPSAGQVTGLIPNGDSSLIVFEAPNSSPGSSGYFSQQSYGIYVPPVDGAMVDITAIGAGGPINPTSQADYGKDTIVSNLLLAAGGPHGGVGISGDAPKFRPGSKIHPTGSTGHTNVTGWYLYSEWVAEGGKGRVFQGEEYGYGASVACYGKAADFSTLTTDLTNVDYATKGGWSGAFARWVGFVTDPIPMRPGIPTADIQFHALSGPGAVLIKEVA